MKKLFSAFTAFLMTLVMGIVLCGCNKVNISKIIEEDASDMITLESWGFTGAYSGIGFNKFTVNGKDGDVFFCYDKSEGLHVGKSNISPSSQVTLNSGETGFWMYDWRDGHTPIETYIDIEWKGQIGNSYNVYIGYAVIKVTNNADYDYSATVIKATTFPTIAGEAQNITKEQITALFEKARKN